jgi:hypothetical protein
MAISRASMGIRISRSGTLKVKTSKPPTKVKKTRSVKAFDAPSRPRRNRRSKRILK